MSFQTAMPWHAGEEEMQRLMHVPDMDNPTSSMMTSQLAFMLQRAPLIAVGTLDSEDRPWTTLWGGQSGMSQPLGASIAGIKTPVDMRHDPVVQILFSGRQDGEVVRESGEGRMIGGLIIDLMTRKRVKLFGRMVAGAIGANDIGSEDQNGSSEGQVQLVIRIDQSLGNCPKYLNCKELMPATPHAKLLLDSPELSRDALELIAKSDVFFLSSSNSKYDMDTNHRGGPAGFVRTRETASGHYEIIWPEYSGNRLYQTLGNLKTTPLAGLVFPDFETGNVLYITGRTEVLAGTEAATVLPRSNLAVRLTITAARFVEQGLPFRATIGEYSPYNPRVRLLKTETGFELGNIRSSANSAKLLEQIPITPTVSRFRFTMNNPGKWKAGQWVALDFSEELDVGYSHMRDDDPQSINDDFVRTFTVSSPPAPRDNRSDDEFEITARKLGSVTAYLFRQGSGSKLELPILGFGGDFQIDQTDDRKIIPFVAGGVGITPLLSQLPALELGRLKIYWTLTINDIDLVANALSEHPRLGGSLNVFFTRGGAEDVSENHRSTVAHIKGSAASVNFRRLQKDDLAMAGVVGPWYICTSTVLRKTLLDWLSGQEVLFEDFNF